MKVSINWLNKFVDVSDLDPKDIAEKLTMCGLEVDAIEEKKSLDNVVVAKVMKCGKHPDADKLSLTESSTALTLIRLSAEHLMLRKGRLSFSQR